MFPDVVEVVQDHSQLNYSDIDANNLATAVVVRCDAPAVVVRCDAPAVVVRCDAPAVVVRGGAQLLSVLT